MPSDSYKLVDALRRDSMSNAQEAFNSAMAAKVNAALDERKVVVAGQIYSGSVKTESYMGNMDTLAKGESKDYQKQAYYAKKFSEIAHKSGKVDDHSSAGYEHRLASKLAKSPAVKKAHDGASEHHLDQISKIRAHTKG